MKNFKRLLLLRLSSLFIPNIVPLLLAVRHYLQPNDYDLLTEFIVSHALLLYLHIHYLLPVPKRIRNNGFETRPGRDYICFYSLTMQQKIVMRMYFRSVNASVVIVNSESLHDNWKRCTTIWKNFYSWRFFPPFFHDRKTSDWYCCYLFSNKHYLRKQHSIKCSDWNYYLINNLQ